MSMSQVEKKDKKPVEITHDFYSKKSRIKISETQKKYRFMKSN